MGRILKTSKDELDELLKAIRAVPAAKITEPDKHLGFLGTIKKHLREYLDEVATIFTEFREFQKEQEKKLEPLQAEVKKLEVKDQPPSDALQEAIKKVTDITAKLTKRSDVDNKKLEEMLETLKTQKVEVNFNNEDFLYGKTLIKDNATTLFINPQTGGFDDDRADKVFVLLEKVE